MFIWLLLALFLAIIFYFLRLPEISSIKPSDQKKHEISLLEHLHADKIVIEKSKHRLTLYFKGIAIRTYPVSLGFSPIGPKIKAGDGKTPEGVYYISAKRAKSHYHKGLLISYPNDIDRQRAKKLGVKSGGDIMIHGLKNGMAWIGESHLLYNWTLGCIALTDPEIDQIFEAVSVKTPVIILP